MSVLWIGSIKSAGQIQVIERVIVSRGETREKAVINGLVKAVRQVQGLKIEELRETRWTLEDIFQMKNQEKHSQTEFSETIKQEIITETKGVVENYEIKEWNDLPGGQWEVKLNVSVPRYESSTTKGDEKTTLAVMPLQIESSRSIRGNINLDEIARQISQGISSRAIQSGFFRVLDRKYEEVWEEERDLIMGEDVSPSEKARLGEKLGADYLVAGTLSQVYSNLERVDYYGLEATKYQVNLTVELRVIEFATREIVWADSITVERAGLSRQTDPRKDEVMNSLIPDLVEDLTDRFNQSLVDVLMPLYIIELRGDKIYLNQGRNRFAKGEELKVMGPPEQIEDPYTDQTRTITGDERARIQVIDTRNDHSIAKIIKGHRSDLKVGLMVERTTKKTKPEDKSILLSNFRLSGEIARNMRKIISTPLIETLHRSLLDSHNFPKNIDILSTKGMNSSSALDDKFGIPAYILTGEVKEFRLKKLDKISGMFVDKYALEFTVRISWRILDKEGNTMVMKEEAEELEFETSEVSGEDPREYYEAVDDEIIVESVNSILEKIKRNVVKVVIE